MNVFTDFHHSSLLKSFILLFEKRMGGNLYRPIGMDWAEKGFWHVYDHPQTQAQYLNIGGATPDGTPPLNEVVGDIDDARNGIYNCKDIESNETNKAITFDAFMSMPFDIVIASIPQHIEPFKKLCEIHPSRPKLIFQIGNQWDGGNTALNIMASVKMDPVAGTHFIQYHQEFDTTVFSPFSKIVSNDNELTFPEKNIYSFVNVFNAQPHFASDWNLFAEVEARMPGWNFKSYGGQCRDGAAHGSKELADKMREARFIWHTKNGGDGYGHVLFNSAAVGRPLITKKSYYQGKLGEELMIDGQTCINIDGLSVNEIIEKIVYFSSPEHYAKLCMNVYENFKKVCDFDGEYIMIKEFLANLR